MKCHARCGIATVLIVLLAYTQGQRLQVTVRPEDFACSQVAVLSSALRQSMEGDVQFSITCQPTDQDQENFSVSIQSTAISKDTVTLSFAYHDVNMEIYLGNGIPLTVHVELENQDAMEDLLQSLLPSPLWTWEPAMDGCLLMRIESTQDHVSFCVQEYQEDHPLSGPSLTPRVIECGAMYDPGTLVFDSDFFCPNTFTVVAETVIITNGALIQSNETNISATTLIVDQGSQMISRYQTTIYVDHFNGSDCYVEASPLWLTAQYDFQALRCSFRASDISLQGGDVEMSSSTVVSNWTVTLDNEHVALYNSTWESSMLASLQLWSLEMENSTIESDTVSITTVIALPQLLFVRYVLLNSVYLSGSRIQSYGSVSVTAGNMEVSNSSWVESIWSTSFDVMNTLSIGGSCHISAGNSLDIAADTFVINASVMRAVEGTMTLDTWDGFMEGSTISSGDSMWISAVDLNITTTSLHSSSYLNLNATDLMTMDQVNVTSREAFLASSYDIHGVLWNVQGEDTLQLVSDNYTSCVGCAFAGVDVAMDFFMANLDATWNSTTDWSLDGSDITLQGYILANGSTSLVNATVSGVLMIDTGALMAGSLDGDGPLYLNNSEGAASFYGPVHIPMKATGSIYSYQSMASVDAFYALEITPNPGTSPVEVEYLEVDSTDNLTLSFLIDEVGDYGRMIVNDFFVSSFVLLQFDLQRTPLEGEEFLVLVWNNTMDLGAYLTCENEFGTVLVTEDTACQTQNGYLVRSSGELEYNLPETFDALLLEWHENPPSMTATTSPSASSSGSISPSRTSTPSPSSSDSSTSTASSTSTRTPAPSISVSRSSTATLSSSSSPSGSDSSSLSPTISVSAWPSASVSSSMSPSPSGAPTPSMSRSNSRSLSMSVSTSLNVSPSGSLLPSSSRSITRSSSLSLSSSQSSSSAPTPSSTLSHTRSASVSHSLSPTSSDSSSVSVSSTPSLSVSTSPSREGHLLGPIVVTLSPSPSVSWSPRVSDDKIPWIEGDLSPSRNELFALVGCDDCEYQRTQFTLTGTNRTITLASRDGTPVVTLLVPANLTPSGEGHMEIQFVRSTEDRLSANGLISPLVDITLLSMERQAITRLNAPLQICLEAQLPPKPNFCLAFFDVHTQEWKCEDLHLWLNSLDQHCGYTSHLTSFALLLGGETSGKSPFNSAISWVSLGLLLGAIGAVLLSVALIELRYIHQRRIQQKQFRLLESSLRKQMHSS